MAFYSNDEYRENPNSAPGTGIAILAHISDSEYPRLLYRVSDRLPPEDNPRDKSDERHKWEQNLIQGHDLDTATVYSEDEKELALAEGWHLTPTAATMLNDVMGEVEMARRGPGRPRKEV